MEEETKQETLAIGILSIIILFGILGALIVVLEQFSSIYFVLPIIMVVTGIIVIAKIVSDSDEEEY